ncbi:MAG TPA: hypothetical protein VGM29_11345, partial [Polyangiaceae bacterium]
AAVSGGIGVVGIVTGALFGLASKSKRDLAKAHGCVGAVCPDEQGLAPAQSAYHDGNISTAAFVIGALGLAGGVGLWFAASSPETQVGFTPGMLELRRSW